MKKLCYILFLFFISFFYQNVYAVSCNEIQCISCTYKIGELYTLTYDVVANGTGGAAFTKTPKRLNESPGATYIFSDPSKKAVSSANFINKEKGKLICPSKIYINYSYGQSAKIGVTTSFSKDFVSNPATEELIDSTDNGKPFMQSESTISKSCSYEGTLIQGNGSVPVTITRNGEELNYEIGNGYKKGNSELVYTDFPNSQTEACPTIYVKCGSYNQDKFCYFYKNANVIDDIHDDEGNEGEETENEEELDNDDSDKTPEIGDGYTDGEIVGICEDVGVLKAFRFVGYILLIVKIIIPIILIILGTIDFGKAITESKADTIQKTAKTFAYRVGAAVIIFLLPTILNFTFNLVESLKFGGEENIPKPFENCRVCIFEPNNCNSNIES